MWNMYAWFMTAAAISLTAYGQDRPIVAINQGEVQGISTTSSLGTVFYAFRGIPYAQPPVGDLRFKRPEAGLAWSGILDGSVDGPECCQISNNGLSGDEDCLFLNVYTPQIPNVNDSTAVMVWIYGGALQTGSASVPAGRFMDYDIILVSFNYRLGVFGFLSTDDEVAPGNYGLWDQLLALQWVHDNIQAFGGDPQKVTIFGQSAGSKSVGFQQLTPHSAGLFVRAIDQSGSPFSPIVIQDDPLPVAQQLASLVNCSVDSTDVLVTCLKSTSKENIMDAYKKFALSSTMVPTPFVAVVETHGDIKFLPDSPLNLMTRGDFYKVPNIAGLTELEGAFYVAGLEYIFGGVDKNYVENHLEECVTNMSNFKHNLDKITERVRQEYFTDVDMDNDSAVQFALSQVYGDCIYNSGVDQYLKLLANNSVPTYMYVFTYQGQLTMIDVIYHGLIPRAPMATHADDTLYEFDDYTLNDQDFKVSKNLLELWTSFVKTGVPTCSGQGSVDWTPFTEGRLQYLRIGQDLIMEAAFRQYQADLWNRVLPEIANQS